MGNIMLLHEKILDYLFYDSGTAQMHPQCGFQMRAGNTLREVSDLRNSTPGKMYSRIYGGSQGIKQ